MNSHTLNGGFAKPGSEPWSKSAFWFPTLCAECRVHAVLSHCLRQQAWQSGASVVAQMSMPAAAVETFGAPEVVYLNVTVLRTGTNVTVLMDLQWSAAGLTCTGPLTRAGSTRPRRACPSPSPLHSRPCRFGCVPLISCGDDVPSERRCEWFMDKLGTPVSPIDVLDGGCQMACLALLVHPLTCHRSTRSGTAAGWCVA